MKKVKLHDSRFFESPTTGSLRCKLNCCEYDEVLLKQIFYEPISIGASVTLLILSGRAKIMVNYRVFELKANNVILLSTLHLFQFIDSSEDFKCYSLFVSKQFMDEMDPAEMISLRTKYGIRLFRNPVVCLDSTELNLLHRRILEINRVLDSLCHTYYHQLVLSAVIMFFLDFSDLVDKRVGGGDVKLTFTRQEQICFSFISLMLEHYKVHHGVDFYADKLGISAHYLTLVVKQMTGQSASKLIVSMLYNESRVLLLQSDLSIQEIAFQLNFSDQAVFGKFFKRLSGVSPFAFRANKFDRDCVIDKCCF